MSSISKLKKRFATVDERSWHYQLVEEAFTHTDLRRTKACTYYWFRVPFAILLELIMRLIVVGAWFFGFNLAPASDRGTFTSYKVSSSGGKQKVAPWEAVGLIMLIYLIYDIGWTFLAVLMSLVIVAGIAYCLGRIGFLRFTARGARATLGTAEDLLDRACPRLNVINPDVDTTWDDF